MTKYCGFCGTPHEEDAKVCAKCGKPFKVEQKSTEGSVADKTEMHTKQRKSFFSVKKMCFVTCVLLCIICVIFFGKAGDRHDKEIDEITDSFVQALMSEDIAEMRRDMALISAYFPGQQEAEEEQGIGCELFVEDYARFLEEAGATPDTVEYELIEVTELDKFLYHWLYWDKIVTTPILDHSQIEDSRMSVVRFTSTENKDAYRDIQIGFIKLDGKWKIFDFTFI